MACLLGTETVQSFLVTPHGSAAAKGSGARRGAAGAATAGAAAAGTPRLAVIQATGAEAGWPK